MSAESTYDIKFQAKADTKSLEDVEARLKQINAELDKMSKSGNYGPDMTKLVNEETSLKLQQVKMQSFRSPAAAGAAEAGATAAPQLAGGMSGLATGAAVAAAGVAVVATAVLAAGAAMIDGARRASDLAQELDKLDQPGKAERLRELGDLGDVLQRNGQILLEYGKNWDEVKRKPEDFLSGLGTAVAPALNEVTEKLNSVNAAKAGEDFGLWAKGIWETVTSVEALKSAWNDGSLTFKPVAQATRDLIDSQRADQAAAEAEAAERRQRELGPIEQRKTADALAKSSKGLMQNQLDPVSRSVDVEIEREKEIAKSMDLSLPEGERSASRRRLEQLNKEYAGLDLKINRASRDATMERDINAATASGDSQRVRELEYLKNYQGLINKGVGEDLAREIAGQRDASAGRKDVPVSSLAAAGHSIGESRAAAEASAAGRAPLDMQRINEQLLEIAKQDKGLKDNLAKWLARPEIAVPLVLQP
jgi:hypothetical protein